MRDKMMKINQIIFACLLTINFNLIISCPTQARKTGSLCNKAFSRCYQFCQKNPEVTPLTATGLIVLALAVPQAVALGFAAGLAAGVPIYHKYYAPEKTE